MEEMKRSSELTMGIGEIVSHASANTGEAARTVRNQERSTIKTAVMESVATRSVATEIATEAITSSYAACESGVSKGEPLVRGDSATEAIIGAAANLASATAHDIPFVVVNTAVRIPAQLMAPPQLHTPENENEQETVAEVTTEATTARATSDMATATMVTPMNEWGRHGFVVAEVYKVLATMEPPWGSSCVNEVMARRFPEIDPTALQMTVLAVLMTQRRCVRDLTLAGAHRGPRRDENGKVFIELDLVYANRYSDSYWAVWIVRL